MKKEFIDNLMVQMKTLQTKLDEEVKRERKEKEELKTNDWRKKFNNNAKLTGDINEAIIISHLMKSGWDVFKNMSCTGPIDMIAYHRENNQTISLDAKSSGASAYAELSKVIHKGIFTCWFDEKNQKVVIVKGEGECIEI
tara:strand:- start:59 stop:478 length:420 start_codon:yes stop_codon:yes gene_type:complete